MSVTVLALVTDAFGGRGGIAQYNRDLLSALAATGHQVVAIPRHAPDLVEPPMGIVQRGARSGRFAYTLDTLFSAWRNKPDIVFCGHIYMAPLGWLLAKLAGAKLVIQMHGIEAWWRPSRLVRWACEQAAMILSVSRYTRAKVLDWAAITPERAVVLPNTVADCFTPGDGLTLRREWDLEGKKVLLTVGRMAASERYKGQDRVIAMLPELTAAGLDVIYVIAGAGDDRPRLEQLAAQADVVDHVRFIGPLSRPQLIDAYRMADLYVMPSTGEGFGIVFLEAMACGTRALGLNVAGAADALMDGALGHIANEAILGQSIADILSTSDQDRAELSRKSLQSFGIEPYRCRISNIIAMLGQVA